MADVLLANLGDWLNLYRLADNNSNANSVEQEARATLVCSPCPWFACTALKPHASASAGIALSRNLFRSDTDDGQHVSPYVCVSKMAEDSIFAGTGLAIGMQVCTINNQVPASPSEAAHIIRSAVRIVTIVAHMPTPQTILRESLVAAAVELESQRADLLRDITFRSFPLTELVYVSRVLPHSQFDIHSPLKAGMVVYSINNERIRSVAEAMESLRAATKVVTILAENMQLELNETSTSIDSLPLAEVIISGSTNVGGGCCDCDDENVVAAIPARAQTVPEYVLPATALSLYYSDDAQQSPSESDIMQDQSRHDTGVQSDVSSSSSSSVGNSSTVRTSMEEWHEATMTANEFSEELSSSGSERNVDDTDERAQQTPLTIPDASEETFIEI